MVDRLLAINSEGGGTEKWASGDVATSRWSRGGRKVIVVDGPVRLHN
jgi:hypothetical protein